LHLDYEEISPKSLISYTLLAINVPGKIKVLQHVEDSLTIWVDTNKMQRVFTNLVKNAFDAMPDGGSLEISSRHDEQTVNFSFIDTGCGMSEDVAKKFLRHFLQPKLKVWGLACQFVSVLWRHTVAKLRLRVP
jgi:signal transduction histidine kinase